MIEVYLVPAGIPGTISRARPVVIIDVFRASTSIAAALDAGARAVYVAGSMAEADEIKKRLGPETVLAGERDGLRIDGYDLGNSPHEMKPEVLRNRAVIFNSTNGTRLLRQFDAFEQVVIGSFVCMRATEQYLVGFDEDPVICAAGQVGKISGEDTLAVGMLVSRLYRAGRAGDDGADLACRVYEAARDAWRQLAHRSYHGQYLSSLGLGGDLPYCTDLDRFGFVPVKMGGGYVPWKPEERG